MSNFKTKAQEVYAQGVDERGNFTPTGKPLAIYKWWAERSTRAPERENFCHFWRVVAIWAPLMFVTTKVESAFEKRGVQVYSLLLALVALGWLVLNVDSIAFLTFGLLAIVYAAAGLFSGGYLAIPEDEIRPDNKIERNYVRAAGVVTLPFALIGFTAVKIKRAWTQKWSDTLLYVFLAIAGLWFLTWLVFGFIQVGWMLFVYIGAVVASVAAVIAMLHFTVTYFAGRRAARKAAERDALAKARVAFWEGEGPDPDAVEPRQPGRVARFFSGVLDFLILVGQVVRVKKWKICPMVEIEGDTNAHPAQG